MWSFGPLTENTSLNGPTSDAPDIIMPLTPRRGRNRDTVMV